MKYGKKYTTLEEGIKKEWLITNGIGGFASSTIINCNTRKYHGLLIAPLTPPARRFLVVSKIDESIQIEDKKYNLYTNICKGYISEGYQYQESFEKDYIPIFTYQVRDTQIKKLICMKQMENTVCILYKIKNGNYPATLILAPVVNFRDFHQVNANHEFKIRQRNRGRRIKVVVDDNSGTPIYINASEGNYIEHKDDTFRNMYYIEEEKRGFYAEENHAVIGRYEIELLPNEEKEISLVCSLQENIEEVDAKEVINKEIIRINELMLNSQLVGINTHKDTKEDIQRRELVKDYLIASDNFVVYRPAFGMHTLMAGYHWFLDWGRDALISFEGLVLIPKRYDIAKEILLTFTKNIKFGLVPNGYSGFDNRPLYNSADASLLLFEQVKKYLDATGDERFVKENLYHALLNIIESYKSGISFDDNNIYLDKDYLIVSGTPKTQNTWMDAKCGDFVVTPRNGKAVEMNSLWYNALKIAEELVKKFEGVKEAKTYNTLASKCKKAFEEEFYCVQKNCLYDVIGDNKIRPNQLFSMSLTYPVLDTTSEIADEVFKTVAKKLLNKYGLKTLAKAEKGYIEIYEGDPYHRDTSYHQGITWPWLLGLYNDAFINRIRATKDKIKKKERESEYEEFVNMVRKSFSKMFYEDGIVGSISELYDSQTPYLAKGALAQGWSVSEVFKILLKNQ